MKSFNNTRHDLNDIAHNLEGVLKRDSVENKDIDKASIAINGINKSNSTLNCVAKKMSDSEEQIKNDPKLIIELERKNENSNKNSRKLKSSPSSSMKELKYKPSRPQ